MAVDTRNKRFSMMGLGSPTPKVLPNPDGTIAAEDRVMLVFGYPLTSTPVVTPTAVISTLPRRLLGRPRLDLYLTTDSGKRLADLSTALGFSCSKIANGVGQFNYVVPKSFDRSILKRDQQIQVWYAPGGSDSFLWNVYLLRTFHYWSNGMEFGGPDVNSLLTRRIVAAKSTSSQARKLAMPADDMMKEVVTESLLDSADPVPDYGTRDWTNFSVAADLSAGPTISNSFPFKKLLTMDGGGVLPILAKAAKEAGHEVFFGVHPNILTGSSIDYEFRTAIDKPGADVSSVVTFEEISGNLGNPDLVIDYLDEANYIYGTGQGQETERKVMQVWDEERIAQSIWGRIEAEADSRNQGTPEEVEASAQSKLYEGRGKIRFTGKALDTDTHQFGVDWNFGDIVTSKFDLYEFKSLVRAVTISVNSSGRLDIDTRLDYESEL